MHIVCISFFSMLGVFSQPSVYISNHVESGHEAGSFKKPSLGWQTRRINIEDRVLVKKKP